MVVSVNWTVHASMNRVAAFLGRGLRSLLKAKPTRVAPPTITATGSVRAKPQAKPWGTKYEIQYQPRMPIHGVRRLTGTRARMETRTAMSLIRGLGAKRDRARSLFHRDALGEVARLIHVASSQYGDVISEELERNHGDERT